MSLVERYQASDGWTYEVYTPDTPSEEFGVCKEFKTLWDSKRRGESLPAWKDFDFWDFEPWWGWLAVEDIVSSDPYETVFRLWGTKQVELFSVELTNKPSSASVGDVFLKAEPAIWTRTHKTKNLLMGSGTIDWLKDRHILRGMRLCELSVPLANDGEIVDKYLSVSIVL